MMRFTLPAVAFITASMLAVSPGLACERHMNHTAAVTAVVVPAPPPVPVSKTTGVLISPAAAAAMSVSEALGTEPYDMRCPRMRAREALTQ